MALRTAVAVLVLALLACASGPRPDVAGAQRDLARELIARRDWPRAFAVADAMCRSEPGSAEPFLLRGLVHREQGFTREAEADFMEAIRLDDKFAPAHSALGVLLDDTGRSSEALDHHRRAVELSPQDPNYLNNLGFALFASGRPRDAIGFYLEALRAAPHDRRIRNNLGFAYAAAGDFTRAAQEFAKGGTPAEARNNLGFAYERRGALGQAFDLYVEALKADPAFPRARENLARVARALNRPIPEDVPTLPAS